MTGRHVIAMAALLALSSFAAGTAEARGQRVDPVASKSATADAPRTSAAEGFHTVTWWCVDLNDLWHVDVPVIVGPGAVIPPDPPPLPPCAATSAFPVEVPQGSGWMSGGAVNWYTHTHYTPEISAALADLGYEFVSGSPMEDLRRKITEIRYVVRTFPANELVAEWSFEPQRTFRLVRAGAYYGALGVAPIEDPVLDIHISADQAGRLPLINFPAIGNPLPPGSYRANVFWVLSALHNDGLGLGEGNFLPAGEFLIAAPRFVVVP